MSTGRQLLRSHPVPPSFRRESQRGSVLIVALLVAALIALVLGSYLALNTSSIRFAKRTFDGYAALNLAEAGAEEAVWSFNRTYSGDATAWNSWTAAGSAAWQNFPNFSLGDNTTGAVKVYVTSTSGAQNAQPTVVTLASITTPGQTVVTKMIEVKLHRRSLFANGIVGRQSVTFAGNNASVDSWNSDPDNDSSTAPVAYSSDVRTDHGSVATMAVANSAVLLNQANVWGYVATGGGQPEVGTNGSIRGATTPAGVTIDASRISTDFNANLEAVTAPSDGTFIASVGSTLGVAGTTTKWRTPSVSISGGNSLTILGNVTLVLTSGSGVQAFSVTGSGSLIIAPDSSLVMYCEGDMKLAGRGLTNANVQPITCQFFGTNQTDTGQSVEIAGNGSLNGVFYGPNADLKINGNGDVTGAFIARNVTITGNAAFHFDESLGLVGNASFGMTQWRELTSQSDMAPYLSLFGGW